MATANQTNSTDVVTVGCKLPHGLHLDVDGVRISVNGLNSTEIVGGHGLTPGVPKAFWERWKAEHADFVPLQRGFIFAQGKTDSAIAEAKDRKDEKTGFEGLDPNNPGKGVNSTEAQIVRGDEQPKA